VSEVDVAIIGAGPAGLAAATELGRHDASVVILEREAQPGGIPRHSDHQGSGLRDLRRLTSGPRYARRWTELAERAGAELRPRTQVTGWSGEGVLELTSPHGREELRARAVVLATGCRERPRPARLVPGTRPQGVMTTGMLQQLVYLGREPVGERAVVVGAEHVSFSALMTLAHAGARAAAMVTELPHHQSFGAFRIGAAARYRVPLRTRTTVTRIHGGSRVEGVELMELDSGRAEALECDLVVFTADWIPDHELAALAGAELDPGTRGPLVDGSLRTTRLGLFAAGNVLRGAETADVAALEGRHVAAGVLDHLGGRPWAVGGAELRCEDPLQWVVPNVVAPGSAPPRGRYLMRAREKLLRPRLELRQDGRVLAVERPARLMPGRSTALAAAWTAAVDPAAGPVIARVLSARRAW
jgi:thioredoxin reductase